MNKGMYLLSRRNLLNGKWKLHPQVVEQIWKRYGRTTVDFFALCNTTHCPLFYSLLQADAPLGIDVNGWTSQPDILHSIQIEGTATVPSPGGPLVAIQALCGRNGGHFGS